MQLALRKLIDIDARGLVRLQADHITRTVVPGFYRFLQAQETEKQITAGKEYREALENLVKLFERIEREVVLDHGVSGVGERTALLQGLGLWFDGQTELGWVDIMGAPCKSDNLRSYSCMTLF